MARGFLRSYRRGVTVQMGGSIKTPNPYYPAFQADQRGLGEDRRHIDELARDKEVRNHIASFQPSAAASIVRCTTQAYTFTIPAISPSAQPVLALKQNIRRVFLSVIAAKGNAGVIGFSFNFPGTQQTFKFPAYILSASQDRTFNSSVVPVDDIYISGDHTGDFVTLYEGIDIGGMVVP